MPYLRIVALPLRYEYGLRSLLISAIIDTLKDPFDRKTVKQRDLEERVRVRMSFAASAPDSPSTRESLLFVHDGD